MEYVKEVLDALSLVIDWVIANGPKMLLASTVVAGLIAFWKSRQAQEERTAKERMVDAVASSPELAVKRIADSLNPDDPNVPPLSPSDILKFQKDAIKEHIAGFGMKAIDNYVAKKKEKGNGI